MVEHTERMLQEWQHGETRDIHREIDATHFGNRGSIPSSVPKLE
jgi:hypothetical protein